MTNQEIIDVVTAAEAGKTIQVNDLYKGWVDVSLPDWDFVGKTYRVKPDDPRSLFLATNGNRVWYYTASFKAEEALKVAPEGATVIEFREVL